MPVLPGIGVITLDTGLRVRSWNGWLAEASGVPEADTRGRPIADVVAPQRAALIQTVLAEVIDAGTTRVLAPALHHFLVRCPAPAPNPHFADMQQLITIAPLRDDAAIVGAIVTIEDVTGRMVEEREQALERAAGGPSDAVALAGAADWRQRAAATRALTERATDADVAQLLEAIQRDHDDFSVLSGALQVLVALRRDVTDALVRLLAHASANVRMHAALAFGALGDQRGVPALLHALVDPDVNVRFHAIEALGRLAAPDAVEALGRIAASGDFFLAFPAIDALARIDDPAVGPTLVGLLGSEHLQPAVIDALAALGDEDSVGALVELMNDGRANAAAVATALARIARRYDDSFAAADCIAEATRAAIRPAGVQRLSDAAAGSGPSLASVVTVLGWIGPPALPTLVALLGRADVHESVRQAVLAIGPAAVPALVAELRDGARESRAAAAELLGAIGDSQAGPALIDTLGSHDSAVLVAAARALASMHVPAAADGLFALFANPDPMVRQAAVSAVNSLGSAAAETRVRALLADPEPLVRECAVRAAGYCGFASCRTDLLHAAMDPAEDVRRAAIEQLPLVDDPRALDGLLAALTGETPRNRAAAAHALRLVDDGAVDPPLVAALSDDDSWVRYFAAAALGQKGATAAARRLEQLAQADPAPYVRIAALTALGRLDGAALGHRLGAVLADADAEIAAAALRALPAADAAGVAPLVERVLFAGTGPARLAAAEVLGRVATPAAVHSLAWAARLRTPVELVESAVHGLGAAASADDHAGRVAAVAALVELGLDGGHRERVLTLLSALPSAAVPALATALSSSRVGARVLALEALARMRTPAATTHVLGALQDEDASVRSAAVLAVGRVGTAGPASTLMRMAASDPDAGVRRRAAMVCRRYGWIDAHAPTAEAR